MKEIPILFSTHMVQALLDVRKTQTRRLVKDRVPFGNWDETVKHCPYGQPGDLLYVRETWFPAAINGDRVLVGYHEKDTDITIEITTDRVEYYWKQLHKGRMIPSIHMPKESARIWLQATDVRVERLQDISEEDSKAEGLKVHQTQLGESYFDYTTGYHNGLFTPRASFRTLWQSINGQESWEANPWVWVISFKVLSTTGKPK